MSRKAVKKFTCIVLAALAAFYVLYHLYVMIFPSVKTETAYVTQAFDSIDAQAYIIRDEIEIPTASNGYMNFILNDADKIEKNGVVAQVYASEKQGLLKKKADLLEREIKRLESLNSFSVALSTTPSAMEQQAYLELNSLIKKVHNSDFDEMPSCKEKILYLLNERQLATGQTLALEEKIAKLREELAQVNAGLDKSSRSVLADEAGYFVGKTDGYEKAFNYADVKKITADQVSSLLENTAIANENDSAAKLVTDSNWYVVCNLKKDEALPLSVDQSVTLTMPLVSASKLNAKIVAINQVDRNSPAAVVFQCDYIDENVLAIRKEPVKINLAEYKGLAVSKSAIHEKTLTQTVIDEETGKETQEKKLVKGVYVLNGKQLVFKEIDIIFSADDYVICSVNPDKSRLFSDGTIKEYDEVVVKGRELYDGKFIR